MTVIIAEQCVHFKQQGQICLLYTSVKRGHRPVKPGIQYVGLCLKVSVEYRAGNACLTADIADMDLLVVLHPHLGHQALFNLDSALKRL